MDERMNGDVAELHPDKQLALAIERGEITKEEVSKIWQATSDLTAQTPIAVRKAVMLMRQCEGSFEKAWPLFMGEMLRMMANTEGAITRDESKFAHLVAGTETIVKTLQDVNPLHAQIQEQNELMRIVAAEIRELRRPWWSKLARLIGVRLSRAHDESVDVDPDDFEKEADDARKSTIGSAWAK